MVSIMSTIPVNSIAKTKSNNTLYKNPVFTKKLYQQTKNIGFGSDGSILAKDKKTVKQIYKLLATMKITKNNPLEKLHELYGHIAS